MTPALTLSDFHFDLPPDLIAQHPLPDRAASRLLHVTPGALQDLHFTDLETLLAPGELLVFNDTRVIKARLHGHKESGGKAEVLIERILAARTALALVRTSHTPKDGTRFVFGAQDARVIATVGARTGDFFQLEFDHDIESTLQRIGEVPLPPYIRHAADAADERSYQTVYARQPGAVAAPTAGLHFTETLLDRLRARGVEFAHVTLHVGAGTFQPVRNERLDQHVMHAERYAIPPQAAAAINAARAACRTVTAVGTTSLRALESAARDGKVIAGSGDTRLFITPGFKFQVVDRLLTNFHLPKSTLLMRVSAFAGPARIRAAYAHAIDRRYRFFSYGDAMLLEHDRAPASR